MITEGCKVDGEICQSVLFAGVTVGPGAVIEDSILMPGVVVESGATVKYSIIAENVTIHSGAEVGCRRRIWKTRISGASRWSAKASRSATRQRSAPRRWL